MPGNKTRFQLDWINPQLHPEWVDWLAPVSEDNFKASCKFCSKNFALSNMGIQAIKSHAAGPLHQKRVQSGTKQQVGIDQMFKMLNKKPESSSQLNMTSHIVKEKVAVQSSSQLNMTNYIVKEKAVTAEALWALRLVMNRQSFNSTKYDNLLFKKMFPDSNIAQAFAMKPSKARYVIAYGLAPYFREKLLDVLSTVNQYVICFDEALNKVSQKGQMDIHVRFWHDGKGQVCTRYLQSVFLGHSTAEDLKVKFKEGMTPLVLNNIAQISMDGPNVNWKFLTLLKSELEMEPSDRKILQLGSCGLHVVHGALQSGHNTAGWNVHSFLRGLYYLFKDSPARRAD